MKARKRRLLNAVFTQRSEQIHRTIGSREPLIADLGSGVKLISGSRRRRRIMRRLRYRALPAAVTLKRQVAVVLVEAEIWTITRIEQGYVVFLRPLNRDVSVPICIGPLEVQAILAGLGGLTVPRPLTHDLLLALMSRVGLDVLRVLIHELKDATFYAQLIMSQKHSPDVLIMDSRPSDALALAVRRKRPILISEAIVSEAGIPADILIGNALGPVPLQKKKSKRENLLSELNSAVAVEDYERAAEIRDILIRLEQEGD